jgi:transcriptional regulator with XRE-family HTH domain
MSTYGRQQIANAFGATLRAIRLERGLSQDRLSDFCDLDRTYPSLLERGLRSPTLAMILRLAQAMNVEPERLVTETRRRLRGEL